MLVYIHHYCNPDCSGKQGWIESFSLWQRTVREIHVVLTLQVDGYYGKAMQLCMQNRLDIKLEIYLR